MIELVIEWIARLIILLFAISFTALLLTCWSILISHLRKDDIIFKVIFTILYFITVITLIGLSTMTYDNDDNKKFLANCITLYFATHGLIIISYLSFTFMKSIFCDRI